MYKSLEQQIQELWESRGLKVLEETVEPVGEGKFKWTIIAEPIKKTISSQSEKLKGYKVEVSEDNWVRLPLEITKDRKRIELTIKALQIIKKIDEGKYVRSIKGIINKIKHYFLGYILITDHPVKPIP